MLSSLHQEAARTLAARYGHFTANISCTCAPGRLNLLGEHTDYNGGLVLPIAINRHTAVAVAPGHFGVRVWSEALGEEDSFTPGEEQRDEERVWVNYIRGVSWALGRAGVRVPPLDMVITSDVPLGGGVSSSASLEAACALAMLEAAGETMPERELALLCRQAENDFVGMRCGIMDPFAVLLSRAGHALFIDCRQAEVEYVPLEGAVPLFYVCDTGTPRRLVESAYNERRAQCEAVAVQLEVEYLSEATTADLDRLADRLDRATYRRCRYVLDENNRVRKAVSAVRRGDWPAFGELVNASHTGLRDEYEVSSTELDIMCELALQLEGCLGARMVGAGFGGCAMAVVVPDAGEAFQKELAAGYQAHTGIKPRIFPVSAATGAGLCR